MKWISEIIKVEPYKIICKWNDNEIYSIDLEKLIAKNPRSSLYQLMDKKRFSEVKCDGTTIYWENGIAYKDIDGQIKPGPLDLDPDVLYEMMSSPVLPFQSKI